ncbi:MAG: hypothetical protein ACREBQ_10105 [Nitrososphaerales archaeon]
MRIAKDNTREFLKRISRFVESDGGRNLNEISRSLSIPYQTIRFRMLHLGNQGISVQPVVNLEKLGLCRYRVSFNLSHDVTNYKSFFGGLHQKAGLAYYARTEFSQTFDCEFFIPIQKKEELGILLQALKERKVIKNVEASKVVWKELLGLRTEYYDYTHHQWDVDFSKLSGNPSVHREVKPSQEVEKFDRKDILLVKSLQTSPWAKVTELSEKLHVPEADLAYHLNKHVFGRKLIHRFILKWAGTKEAWAKHSTVMITLVFKDISDASMRYAMSVLTSIPFTWNHLRTESSLYMAELLVPVALLPEVMLYLSDSARLLDLAPEVLFADPYCLSTYTIPYLMYDHEKGWVFKAEGSLGHVLQMTRSLQ